jgi:hypothetical protein
LASWLLGVQIAVSFVFANLLYHITAALLPQIFFWLIDSCNFV